MKGEGGEGYGSTHPLGFLKVNAYASLDINAAQPVSHDSSVKNTSRKNVMGSAEFLGWGGTEKWVKMPDESIIIKYCDMPLTLLCEFCGVD